MLENVELLQLILSNFTMELADEYSEILCNALANSDNSDLLLRNEFTEVTLCLKETEQRSLNTIVEFLYSCQNVFAA